jgi:hypothetical protein
VGFPLDPELREDDEGEKYGNDGKEIRGDCIQVEGDRG